MDGLGEDSPQLLSFVGILSSDFVSPLEYTTGLSLEVLLLNFLRCDGDFVDTGALTDATPVVVVGVFSSSSNMLPMKFWQQL